MKKILSFILTLAMVMSLGSVPVFAADTITSTDEGNNSASQSVTANYIPEAEKAAITGVSVTVDGKTYNSGDTVTLTPNSGSVTITVKGNNFTNLNSDNHKLLYVDGSYDDVSSADGWTVNDENTEASKTFELSKFQNCTTAFEIKYSNEGDVSDKYMGSGIYIQYQNKIVSVGITWGAMNFTYSDEQVDGSDKGWTCETGANTVKIENNGDESIVAGISYKQENGYTAISGTFDKTSETIAKDGNATFTLTLSGKPDAALSGATVGTVTIEIKEAKFVYDATSVGADDLKTVVAAQLAAGKTDIEITMTSTPEAAMFSAIHSALTNTEGVADGSINLTLKGVTTIPDHSDQDWRYAVFGEMWRDENGDYLSDAEGVTQLASVNLPDVLTIGDKAFNGCENLTVLTAPKVQTIGKWAFYECGLTSVNLPEATTIGGFTFFGCSKVAKVDLPKVTVLGDQTLDLVNIDNEVTIDLTSADEITVHKDCFYQMVNVYNNLATKVNLVLNGKHRDQVSENTWTTKGSDGNEVNFTFKSITFID